ncbi:MAG: hypothetical protein QM773_00080 [Hyphomonadaceae bacterium]
MRFLTVAAIGLGAAWMAPLGHAQAITDEPSAGVKACIGANAPGVERVIDQLDQATDFLVKKVCLGVLIDQIIERNKREMEAQKARADAMCAELKAKPKPAPKPGANDPSWPDIDDDFYMREMCETDSSFDFLDGLDTRNTDSLFFGGFSLLNAPRVEALAAQTLLKLRVERLNRK